MGFFNREPARADVAPLPSEGAALGAISARSLSKYYGSAVALDDVSISIAPGSFTTLLGPSGSGKTTLLMAIAGFVPPSSGSIQQNGRDITALPPDKRNFGMVFQGYALFPHLTIAENVAFPLRVRGIDRATQAREVKRALEMVQMEKFADRLPRQLSGGQQQRVALARAMVFRPGVMLLDEPLSALDKNLRQDLQTELKDLHRRIGMTFIYVTHDQHEALSMSDEIAIMAKGRIVQSGTPAELYDHPKSRFIAAFLGLSNFISGRVERRTTEGFTYTAAGVTLRQAGGGDAAPGAEICVTLRPEKLRLLAPGETAANRLTGRVKSFDYHGHAFHIRIDVPDLGEFRLDRPTWRQVPPQEGETVTLGWEADATVLLAGDDTP